MAAATKKEKKRKEEAYPWKAGSSSRHITSLKQSILDFRYLWVNCTDPSPSMRIPVVEALPDFILRHLSYKYSHARQYLTYPNMVSFIQAFDLYYKSFTVLRWYASVCSKTYNCNL
jgi:hypothetical protein